MSRWGALFAALSHKDTIDTIDTKPPSEGGALNSGNCVDCVPGNGSGGAGATKPIAPPAEPWLAHIARRIAAALAAGAEREADPEGGLALIRPDGDRFAADPHIVAELDRAGLLPALPDAVERSTYAARARPAEWWDGTDTPQAGDRCRCGAMRFWTERDRRGGWRCSTCHPPLHLAAEAVEIMTT